MTFFQHIPWIPTHQGTSSIWTFTLRTLFPSPQAKSCKWKTHTHTKPTLLNEKHKSWFPLVSWPLTSHFRKEGHLKSWDIVLPLLYSTTAFVENYNKKVSIPLQIPLKTRALPWEYDPNRIETRLSCWMLLVITFLFQLKENMHKAHIWTPGHVFLLTA